MSQHRNSKEEGNKTKQNTTIDHMGGREADWWFLSLKNVSPIEFEVSFKESKCADEREKVGSCQLLSDGDCSVK